MANIFTRLVEAYRPTQYIEQLRDARMENDAKGWENTRLRESIRDLSLLMEDLNWTKLGTGWESDDSGLSLTAVKENSDILQSLLTINPVIKKAINARVGYIWGRGVSINPNNDSLKNRVINTARNKAKLFSEHAYWSLEATLATDGNLWAQRDKKTNEVIIVPLEHIGGWVCDEDDPSRVNYWLVSYERTVQNFSTNTPVTQTIKYFVPAHDANKSSTANIDDIPVRRDIEMIHLAANLQRNWILGVPDIMAAMFWAKAHKELFEAGTTFVKAQGRYAAKVVSKTELGGQSAAATVRDTPRRDEATGESLQYGGTAIATGGLDYQLMGAMTKGVDFKSFDPVGALVAAGLGIPLRVLMADSGDDVTSLEQSVVNEMQMRQKLWSWFYIAIFGGGDKIEVFWPKIRTEPEYRRIQSVEIANQTNVLSRVELRQLSLEAFGLDGDVNALPSIKSQPDVAISAAQLIAHQNQDAKNGSIDAKGQGVATGIGKLSNGSDAKDARNNPIDSNVQGQ